MTVEQIKQQLAENGSVWIKYVRTANGEYRFSDAADYLAPEHKTLAKNEPVESAGFFKIRDEMCIGGHSMTLNKGPCDADYADLPRIFNIKLDKEYLD